MLINMIVQMVHGYYAWFKNVGSQIVCSNGLACDVFVYEQGHCMA